eukprot:1804768-Alexandrium_andersonii.AAC.1
MEVVARRIQQITEAYRDGAERPNWESTRHFSGRRSALDVVAPTLRSHAAQRAREEALIESSRRGGQ